MKVTPVKDPEATAAYVEKYKGFTVMAANEKVVKSASFLQAKPADRPAQKFQLSNRKASYYLGGAADSLEPALPSAEQQMNHLHRLNQKPTGAHATHAHVPQGATGI